MRRGAARKRDTNDSRTHFSMPSTRSDTMPDTTMRFTTTVADDGTIRPPADIARTLRHTRTVDVELAVRAANSLLLQRGVSAAEIERVVEVQRLPVDVVEYVLGGEGSIAPQSALYERLHHLQTPGQ